MADDGTNPYSYATPGQAPAMQEDVQPISRPVNPYSYQDPSATAAGARASAYGVQPAAVGTAIRSAPDSGIPPVAGMYDPQSTSDMANAQRASTILQQNPSVAAAVGQSSVHAAATQNDLPALDQISKFFSTIGQLSANANKAPDKVFGVQALGHDVAAQVNSPMLQAVQASQEGSKALVRGDVWGVLKSAMDQANAIPNIAFGALLSPIGVGFNQAARGIVASGVKTKEDTDPFDQALQFIQGKPQLTGKPLSGEQAVEYWNNKLFMAGLLLDIAGRGGAKLGPSADVFSGGGRERPGGPSAPIDVTDVPFNDGTQKRLAGPTPKETFDPQQFEAGLDQPGVDPYADGVHAAKAEADAAVLGELQDQVAKTEMQTHASEVTPSVIDTLFPDTKVYIDTNELAKLEEEPGGYAIQDFNSLPDEFKDKLIDGHMSGGQAEMTLGEFLGATAGHPMADVLKQVAKFDPDGVTLSEVPNLQVQSKDAPTWNHAEDESGGIIKGPVLDHLYNVLDSSEVSDAVDLKNYLPPETIQELKDAGLLPNGTAMQVKDAYDLIENSGSASPYKGWEPDDADQYFKDLAPEDEPPLDPTELAALNAQAPAIQAAVQKQIRIMAPKDAYLKQLFESPGAARMSPSLFKNYSQKLEQAHKDLYTKLVKQAIKDLRAWRTKEWQKTWKTVFAQQMDAVMADPAFKAYNILRFAEHSPGGSDPRDMSQFFRSPGQTEPTKFYHGSTVVSIGTKENPWKVPPNSAHSVISFAEDPKFASDWVMKKVSYAEITPTDWNPTGVLARTQYIVYLKAKNVADFRKPEDTAKAAETMADRSGAKRGTPSWQQSYDFYYDEFKRGSWINWEKSKELWPPNGWDGARMVEHFTVESKAKPNICIEDGNLVEFVYSGEQYSSVTKINSAERKLIPKELRDRLPSDIFAKDGGDANELAANYGFANKEDMFNAIAALHEAKGRKHFGSFALQTAKDQAFNQVQQQLGYAKDKADWDNEARNSVDMPTARDLLIPELQALAELTGAPFSKADIEALAQQSFEQLPARATARAVRRITSDVLRLMRQGEAAIMKGTPDYIKAFEYKQKQLLALYKLEKAQAFAKEYAKGEKLFNKIAKNPILPGVDQTANNLARSYLEDVGYPAVRNGKWESPKSALEGLTYEAWQTQTRNGPGQYNPVLGPTLPTDYTQFTVGQWEQLRDTIKSWNTIGKELEGVRLAGELVSLGNLVKNVKFNADAIGRRFTPGELDATRNTLGGQAGHAARTLGANAVRVETQLYLLDREQYGPLMQLFKQMEDGKFMAAQLKAELNARSTAFIKTLPKDWQKKLDEDIDVPELTYSIRKDGTPAKWIGTRGEFLGLLRYLGTDASRIKLFEGYGWDPAVFQAAAEKHLNEKWYWDLNQHVIDQWESLWPHIRDTYRHTEGLAPKKELAREITANITTPEGKQIAIRTPGGYSKIRYDWRALGEAQGKEIKDPRTNSADSRFGRDHISPLPPNKYTLARTGFSAPLIKDWNAVFSDLEQTIHDVSYRGAIINFDKVLAQPSVKYAINEVLGPEYFHSIDSWLTDTARMQNFVPGQNAVLARWLRGMRYRLSRVALGYNMRSWTKHSMIALSHSIGSVKPEFLARAVAELSFGSSQQEDMLKFVNNMSGEVRSAMQDVDRDIQSQISLAQKTGPINFVQQHAYTMYGASKRIEATVLWLGKYYEALSESMDEERAIFLADKTIRDTQGGGSALDLPGLYRQGDDWQGELAKLFYLFSSFENTTVNKNWVIQRNAQRLLSGGGGGFGKPPGSPGYDEPPPEDEGAGVWVDRGPAGDKRDWQKIFTQTIAYNIVPIMITVALDAFVYKSGTDKDGIFKAIRENAIKNLVGGLVPMTGEGSEMIDLLFGMADEQIAKALGDNKKGTKRLQPEEHDPSGLNQLTKELAIDYRMFQHIQDPHNVAAPKNWVEHANNTLGYLTGFSFKPAAHVLQHIWDIEHSPQASNADMLTQLRDMIYGGDYGSSKAASGRSIGGRSFGTRKIR